MDTTTIKRNSSFKKLVPHEGKLVLLTYEQYAEATAAQRGFVMEPTDFYKLKCASCDKSFCKCRCGTCKRAILQCACSSGPKVYVPKESTRECKFGMACKRTVCAYTHPAGFVPQKNGQQEGDSKTTPQTEVNSATASSVTFQAATSEGIVPDDTEASIMEKAKVVEASSRYVKAKTAYQQSVEPRRQPSLIVADLSSPDLEEFEESVTNLGGWLYWASSQRWFYATIITMTLCALSTIIDIFTPRLMAWWDDYMYTILVEIRFHEERVNRMFGIWTRSFFENCWYHVFRGAYVALEYFHHFQVAKCLTAYVMFSFGPSYLTGTRVLGITRKTSQERGSFLLPAGRCTDLPNRGSGICILEYTQFGLEYSTRQATLEELVSCPRTMSYLLNIPLSLASYLFVKGAASKTPEQIVRDYPQLVRRWCAENSVDDVTCATMYMAPVMTELVGRVPTH